MDSENSFVNDNERGSVRGRGRGRGRGRPSKRSVINRSTGRKRVSIEGASRSTVLRRAHELLTDGTYNISIIQSAARVSRNNTVVNSERSITEEDFPSCHTKESALAFYLEYDYSKSRYYGLVKDSRSRGSYVYPSYPMIKSAMIECEPKNYQKSEKEVLVPLQDMLNKTAERLCNSVALQWDEENLSNLQLITTIGFDSSSGHANPHQHYENEENENPNTHQTLFVSSMIIIQLKSPSETCKWINPTPQSTRFCRPLRIALEKESDSNILREYNRLNRQIKFLNKHKFEMENGKKVEIFYKVSQTLFNGKCINTIVGNTTSSRCPICLRTTHQFSDFSDNFEPRESALQFGLGLLHDEIKAFEHLLHISYRLNLKTWDMQRSVREQFEERKIIVKNNIYAKLGVRVDQVLQGHGTTNTGNVARRCFEKPTIFAEALEIDVQFVKNIATILSVFKCKKPLKIRELEQFCWQTYCLHYTLFPWARMSPTLHKLLKHGCEIAQQFVLPIAYYSEDANESWHKLYTSHGINNRKNRLLDVFNRAVQLTDPKISLILIKDRLQFYRRNQVAPEVRNFVDENIYTEPAESASSNVSDMSSDDEM